MMDEFDQLDRAHEETQRGMLSLAVPPAREPLDGGLLALLTQSVQRTLRTLSGDQLGALVNLTDAPAEGMPADLGSSLVALSSAVDALAPRAPGIERYAFDPAEASTNDGLKDLIRKVDALGSDRSVIAGLTGQQAQGLPQTM